MTPHEHLLSIAAAWREYRAIRDAGGDKLPAIEALSYAIHAGELSAKLDLDPVLVEREACARECDAMREGIGNLFPRTGLGRETVSMIEDALDFVAKQIRNRSEK